MGFCYDTDSAGTAENYPGRSPGILLFAFLEGE
jgi:hypothetical protein